MLGLEIDGLVNGVLESRLLNKLLNLNLLLARAFRIANERFLVLRDAAFCLAAKVVLWPTMHHHVLYSLIMLQRLLLCQVLSLVLHNYCCC